MRTFLGHMQSRWRQFVCLPLAVVFPVSLIGQDVSGAMLHGSENGVFVNESSAPPSIAVFENDEVRTLRNVVARLELTGSTAQINGETMVQFHSDELALDHGSLSIATSRGLRVRVGCITITPVNTAQPTQYDVIDVNGKVTVNAVKDDVYIDARQKNLETGKDAAHRDRSIVHEGEQKSRDEKCVEGDDVAQPTQGVGGIMNSLPARIMALGAAAVVACWGICHYDDPVSPAKP